MTFHDQARNLPANVHQESAIIWERQSTFQDKAQVGQLFIHSPRSVTVDPGIRDLTILWREESLTEEPISDYAFKTACSLLELLRVVFGGHQPAALIAPDSEGGIRIEWFHNGANIRAVIPRDTKQDPYVYVRPQRGESAVREYSPSTVIRALRSGTLNP
jgi:hypothetical protein